MRDTREWTRLALCLGRDPQVYELDGFKGDRDTYARGACVGCPVVEPCAADALEPLAIGTVRGGVWVDPTPRNRHAVRRALQRVAAGHA